MEKKQAVVVGIVLIAVLGLFVVVYTQLSMKTAQAPAVAPVVSGGAMRSEAPVSDDVMTTAPVVQNPQTVDEVAGNIAAQLDQDAASAQAEMQGMVSNVGAQINSADDLTQTYDPNQY